MLVYLDNCCYNRPYDDQNQPRILHEAQAQLLIQKQISLGSIMLVSSYVLSAENSANKFASRREDIKKFMDKYTALYVSDKNRPRIEHKAQEIMKAGLKFMDACHIACAIFAGSDYFLSVDDRVLRFKTNEVRIMNPVDFISELEMIL